MKILASLFLALTLIAPLTAQRPESPVPAQAAQMSKLDFMLGTWKGSGWIRMGPTHRSTFNQTEVVTKKLEGTLITIEGDGRDSADDSRHVHDAFALISYSDSSFHFLAIANGNRLEVVPTVSDHIFQWGFDAPYGKVRYTLDFTSGKWHETGELSRGDGKTWNQNFEMTLTKE